MIPKVIERSTQHIHTPQDRAAKHPVELWTREEALLQKLVYFFDHHGYINTMQICMQTLTLSIPVIIPPSKFRSSVMLFIWQVCSLFVNQGVFVMCLWLKSKTINPLCWPTQLNPKASQNARSPQSPTKLRAVFTCIKRINTETNKEVWFSYVVLKY